MLEGYITVKEMEKNGTLLRELCRPCAQKGK